MPAKKRQFQMTPAPPADLWQVVESSWQAAIDEALTLWKEGADVDQVVHKFRVTVKRLRGFLQLLQPRISAEFWREQDIALRNLNRELADLRTSAVMSTTRDKMGFDGPAGEGKSLQATPVETAAKDLEAMREVISELRPGKTKWKLIEAGMRETYAAGREKFLQWRKSKDLHAAHKCRKYAKYLMFQVDLITQLDPKSLGKLRARLNQLETQLGELNDLVDFEELQTGLRAVYVVREQQRQKAAEAMKTAKQIFKNKPQAFAKKKLRAAYKQHK